MTKSDLIISIIIILGIAVLWLAHINDDRIEHTFQFDNREKLFEIKKICVAGDFNHFRDGMNYMQDKDGDNIWETNISLKRGWHEYRFSLNGGKQWIRDIRNPIYGGEYSNSMFYLCDHSLPLPEKIYPASGSWLYVKPVTGYLQFKNTTVLNEWEITFTVDSSIVPLVKKDSILQYIFTPDTEGEHTWEIKYYDLNGRLIYTKSGLWWINFKNQKPVADAGYTKFVRSGQKAILNGGKSFDPDFEALIKFDWVMLSQPRLNSGEISLSKDTSSFPELLTDTPGKYKFRLTVMDSMGETSSDITEVNVLAEKEKQTEFRFHPNSFMEKIKHISLVGDFNQWQAKKDTLTFDMEAGFWRTGLSLDNGLYEYKYVINNKHWIFDPDNDKKIEDGWQGFNSIKSVQIGPTYIVLDEKLYITEHKNFIEISPGIKNGSESKFYWYDDIKNPDNSWKASGNILQFDKNNKRGHYFYYLLAKEDDVYSEPLTIQINHFDKTTCNKYEEGPAWADTAIIYEIFLRKYNYPGTFRGLEKQLDNLKEMGINVIWLMPVTEGPTKHGYAPTNFFVTEADYGTTEEYHHLIIEAHRRGIRIIFDFIANHISDQHRYLQAAFDNPASPLRHWFYWKKDGTWGYHNDWDNLVNLNYTHHMVYNYILDTARFWANLGIDGFRCDVAWAVPHIFWKEFRREIKKINPDILVMNEVLPRQPAFHDQEFDMSYDTDLYGNILDVLNGKKNLSSLDFVIQKTTENYPESSKHLHYIENHDLERFISQFGERRTRLMAALIFTLPGTPLIYYGQEDEVKEMRPDYSPKWNSKTFDFYKSLIKLRKSSVAFTKGQIKTMEIDDEKKLWHFNRQYAKDEFDVFINLSKEPQKIITGKNQTIIFSNATSDSNPSVIDGECFVVMKKDMK